MADSDTRQISEPPASYFVMGTEYYSHFPFKWLFTLSHGYFIKSINRISKDRNRGIPISSSQNFEAKFWPLFH